MEETCNTCGVPMPVAVKASVLHRRYHEDQEQFVNELRDWMSETDTRLTIIERTLRDAG